LDELEREGKARRERAHTVALWRYTLVAPAMDEALTARERGQLVRELAEREHPGPLGGRVRVSRKTLDRWIRSRRRGGFEALLPTPRRVEPRTDAAVLALAVSLKKENPRRTAAQVRRILVEVSPQRWAPAERTLQRHFAARGLTTGTDGRPPKVRGRFEADRINEIWTADTLHGPKIAGRKAYVHGIIDDHSRLLVDYQCVYHDDAARFMTLFRHAIATHGVPSILYVDNGAAFIDEALLRTCARLGIRVTPSTPGEPEGRGKIERMFKTVRGQFLVEVHGDLDNPVGHYVADLAAMGEALRLWVTRVYHRQEHSETGQTPLERWAEGDPGGLPTPEQLRRAFAWTVERTVRKNATVDLEGNRYKVDAFLARHKVELHYDPFDLTEIEVYWRGRLVGRAVPEHIGRHAHPKAPPEPEPEPISPTGIDFIQLLAQADQAETGARLYLSHLADPPEFAVGRDIAPETTTANEQAHTADHDSTEQDPR
jgi:putative transposase